jgi:hypothetical protein
MTARLTCIIPGCRRTHAPIWSEFICAKHWPLVPRPLRRAYARAKRKRKPLEVVLRLWARCKTAAIRENFMGFAP